MCVIKEILPNGCLMILDEHGNGVPYIETGDFQRSKELLSDADYRKVLSDWKPEVIAAWKQTQTQAGLDNG